MGTSASLIPPPQHIYKGIDLGTKGAVSIQEAELCHDPSTAMFLASLGLAPSVYCLI